MPPEWSHTHDSQSQHESTPSASITDPFFRQLRSIIGESRFEKWFQNRTTVNCHGDVLTVGVASPFLTKWMIREFQQPATQAARECLGISAQVRFDVDAQAAEIMEQRRSQSPSHGSGSSEQMISTAAPPTLKMIPTSGHAANGVAADRPLRNRLTPRRRRFASLETFVVGPGNESSHKMSQAVTGSPGDRYNPLYIYGGIGVGKTHLLEGIHRSIRESYPEWQVMSLTAEAFGNYYTKALHEKTLPAFRK